MSSSSNATSDVVTAPIALSPDARRELRALLGAEGLLETAEALADYATDTSGLRREPGLVARPTEIEQVQAILRLASREGFPVATRGAGTGLAGGCLAEPGGLVLDLSRMTRFEIDADNLIARAQPGVITHDLRQAAAAKGLFYPPDPASLSTSTIGGNAATNAGGPACLKYGVTRDYVLGLTAVLASGELLRAGVQTRKGVVGFDLAHLLVGSEGALAVIVELILKLVPLPTTTRGLAAVFPSLPVAMRAVSGILTSGLLPSALEFLDHRCLALVGDLLPFSGLPPTATLLYLEADGSEISAPADMAAMAEACRELGALELLPADDDEARAKVWDVRRQVSLRVHDAVALYMAEDVVVPISRIAELVAGLPELETEEGLVIYAFGHAGDGNIHLNLTTAREDQREALDASVRRALDLVLSLGGTISGEHGIGEAKREFLPLELSERSIELQRGLKQLFDPQGILNPGKIFPAKAKGAA